MEGTLVLLADMRMSQLLRGQAEWMVYIEPRLKRSGIQLSQMSDKINFIIDREMRREGGPETQR